MKKIILSLIALITFSLSIGVSAMDTGDQYASIDSEIFAIQQGVVREISSLMKLSSVQGIRQSGSMLYKTKISTSEASGSVDLRVEEYSTKYDVKTQNIEMKFRGNLDLAINTSHSDYDNYNEDTGEYKQIPVKFSVTIRYDVTLIIARDGTMYVTLSSLDGSAQGYEEGKAGFENFLQMARPYIGKTYKIPSSYRELKGLDMATIESTIRGGLLTLESQPLFVTKSEKNGVYTLSENRAVWKKLGLPVGKTLLTYTNRDQKKIITLANKKSPKNNTISFVEAGDKYTMNMEIKGITNGKKSNMNMSLSKDAISIVMLDRDTDMKIDWKNNTLDMRIVGDGEYDTKHIITARGPLSLDGSNTNIVVSFDGKNIGSFKSIKSGGTVNYSLNMDFDIETTRFLFDWSGIYSEEKGEYNVTLPTIYEILDASHIIY